MKRKESKMYSFAGVIVCCLFAVMMLWSCANIARPEGGPRDETAPVYVRSAPTPQQLSVSKKKIEIEFDELVQLERPMEKVVVSPPQKEMPIIRASGRKVIVELVDSLQPNTTYTIDFADAIADNNEKNILNGFSLSFATGSYIDSLQVSGLLLDARNLEPVTGMLVGAHSQLDDSAFVKNPFQRISSSDVYGHFTIRNMSSKTHRVYGLKDLNRDYRFDNSTEDIAFCDTVVNPGFEIVTVNDTVWKDSITVDTIIPRQVTSFFPNNLVLFSFNEDFKTRYLEKYERKNRRALQFFFTAPDDSLPNLKPLNFSPPPDWALIERSSKNDTITYWIKDSTIFNLDTLQFAASYARTDSLRRLVSFEDTLRFIYREVKAPEKKKKKKDEEEPIFIDFLKNKSSLSSSAHVYVKPDFVFDEPIDSMRMDGIRLETKVDTTWKAIPFRFERDSIALRTYRLLVKKWAPGTEYRFLVDSTAITSIYGRFNDKIKQNFTTKKLEDYSNLYFAIAGVRDSAFVELLNSSDAVVRTAPVKKGGAEFMYVDPGTYYARIVIDRNGNGVYDTGNYEQKRQPERVYYYPKSVALKANWDVEQDWDVFGTPIEKQKPRALVKNKPKTEQNQEAKPEDEDDTQQNSNMQQRR